ncbi:hypothetical protein ABG067_003055 [Albugo candida]
MVLIARTHVLLHLLLGLKALVTAQPYDKTCFELPVLILSPRQPFPLSSCVTPHLPSLSCVKENRQTVIDVIDTKERNCLSMSNKSTARDALVHNRGQSSLRFDKHQFGVTFNQTTEWLDFPPGRTFVLNGPFIDRSLIRNHLAHWLFRSTGRYSPRTRHVVLFIRHAENQTVEYKGIYLAMEKIDYGRHRVGLARLNASCSRKEMNGGWAWEINPLEYGLYSPNILLDKYETGYGYGQRPILQYPPGDTTSQAMRDYFVTPGVGPLPRMFEYLYNNMTDPNGLERHIDIGSFVDDFLHTEMSLNQDAYRRSAFYFKDRNEPINAGPVWDFNLAYGSGAKNDPNMRWMYMPSTFWKRLFCNYKFAGLVTKRWRQLRANEWSPASIQQFVEASVRPIERQLTHCSNWMSSDLQCAHVSTESGAKTYRDEVQMILDIIEARSKWIDVNVGGKLYKSLDETTCSTGGPLPKFNCAADGNESGCLSDPEAFIGKLSFPSIHQAYEGPECSENVDFTNATCAPSVDYCWLSVGTYIEDGTVTPFCSGNGYCPAGPNVTCTCIRECYEFPVVIVKATKEAFPDPTCNQQRYPAPNCLKRAVETTVDVIDHHRDNDENLNCVNDAPSATYMSKTNFRGQSSLFFAKHQMNLRFQHPVNFVGFPEDRVFILNGPYLDCSLLRNHLAHWLYRGTGRYSPKTKHIVLYLQDNPLLKPAYLGIYIVLEKLTFTEHREPLAPLTPGCTQDELNGGWAWQNDPFTYGAESPNMVIDQYQNEFGMGERPILEFPPENELSQNMRDFFVNTTTGFLPKLYRFLWYNMTNPDHLEAHIDLGSFADYILHTEMSLNVDAYRRSTFFFKDRNQPINAGPVWDFNLAYGNGARRDFKDWIYPQYTFWKRLMCNYKLTSLIIQRWKSLRDPVDGAWSDQAITSYINESAAPIYSQLQRCHGDWRGDVFQCAVVDLITCNATMKDQIEKLKTAVLKRSHWMDERITQLYKELNVTICSGVGTIPTYNCAVDGNDDGCLSRPEKYYSAVQFPSIRAPYSGPPCAQFPKQQDTVNAKADDKNVSLAYYFPSIDYCWRVAFGYFYPQDKGVREKNLTHFCNGYGKCQEGPHAHCVCAKGILLENGTCRRIDAFEIGEKDKIRKETIIGAFSEKRWSNTAGSESVLHPRARLMESRLLNGWWTGLMLAGLVVIAMVQYKRFDHHQRARDSVHYHFRRAKPLYGSTGDQRWK